MNNWRDDPATKKQEEKLLFFGCTFDEGITKGQASDAIDECVRRYPELEKAYQDRPATAEQLSRLPQSTRETPLTYGQAKELIEEYESEMEQAEIAAIAREYNIDVVMWADLYPGLTWELVQEAAKSLDGEGSGWREESNHIDLMLARVAQRNPELGESWNL